MSFVLRRGGVRTASWSGSYSRWVAEKSLRDRRLRVRQVLRRPCRHCLPGPKSSPRPIYWPSKARASGVVPGAELTRRAAAFRERLWRLERREGDALEAIELYRASGRQESDASCDSLLRRTLLEAELRGDPAAAYRSIYLARAGAPRDCRARLDAALTALAGSNRCPASLPSSIVSGGRDDARASAEPGLARLRQRSDESGPAGPIDRADARQHSPRGPARITSIERYGARDAARIVVFVTHPTTFEVGFIGKQRNRSRSALVRRHRARHLPGRWRLRRRRDRGTVRVGPAVGRHARRARPRAECLSARFSICPSLSVW